MHYYKYHALGNDYIVIDPGKTDIKLTTENVKIICNRNYGIGSDGILYGPLFVDNNICLKIYNPDGSLAEKSGNGVRIFSRYLVESKYIKKNNFSFKTDGGIVEINILKNDASLIKVNMGKFIFTSSKIPVAGIEREVINEDLNIGGKDYRITCVSVGNPHCVIPLNEISKETAVSLGPLVENNPLFPNRINVQFLKILDTKNIKIEIWERGAGYTLASGSSSCAAACAANRLGYVGDNITVHMPGGNINIDIKDNEVHMTGTVSSISKGNFTKEFMSLIRGIGLHKK
jgi:diaminopimelate epimerase